MTPQSRQRFTCPPRTAVLQVSIARMTFTSSLVMECERRYASPCARKTSATSNAGRDVARFVTTGYRVFLPSGLARRSSGLVVLAMVLPLTWV